MAEVASAFVSLMPSAKGFGKSTERQIGPQMNSVAKTTGARFGKVFAYASMSPLKAIGAAAIGLFAVQKVKQFFQGAIAEARESQKVSALTAQVIKSTGGAAGISAKQVGSLAASISTLTGIDDEAIQGAENLLLTFTNLRNEAGKGNDVFNQATKIVTDMSVALDQDLKSSSIQVGKALNDPIKGITALSRVGVSFTEQQKEQIKTLTESGHRLAAQKIILGELGKEFGGAAAAAATAGDRFRTTAANFQEAIGTAMLPYLDRALDLGTNLLTLLMVRFPPAFAAFKAAVAPAAAVVADFVGNHLEAFKTALSALGGSVLTSLISLMAGGLFSALAVVAGALTSPIALVGALAGAAFYAYTHFESFRTSVNSLATYMQANVIPVLVQLGAAFRADVLPGLVSAGTYLAGTFYPNMINFWLAVSQKLWPSLVALGQGLRSDVLPALQQLGARLKESEPALKTTASLALKVEVAYGLLSASILGKVLPPLVRFTTFILGSHLQALNAAASMAIAVANTLARLGDAFVAAAKDAGRFASGVKDRFGDALQFVSAIPGKIKAALGDLSNILYAAGRAVIGGLISGITSRVGDVISAVSPIAGIIRDHKGPIEKDRALLIPAGRAIIGGLIAGLLDGKPGLMAQLDGLTVDMQKRVLDGLTAMRDGVKGVLDGLRSDFESLRSSVASAFTGDLFNFDNVGDFMRNLVGTRAELKTLKQAFKKLLGWGVAPEFLSSLFQSGNGGLILELAAGNRLTAQAAGMVFGEIGQLSSQLGGQVARADIGPKIDATNRRLERIEHAIDRLPKNFGKEINNAVSHGHRKAS